MKARVYKKLMAGALSLAMLFHMGMIPVQAANDCTHHEHNTDCGYTTGTPCTFNPADCIKCNLGEDNPPDNGAVTATIVTGFAAIDESLQQQSVEAGTELSALTLPGTLTATGHTTTDSGAATELTIEGVTWQLDPTNEVNNGNSTYDPDQGSYAFTSVLPAGYTVEEGTLLPEIWVMVGTVRLTTLEYDMDTGNLIIPAEGCTCGEGSPHVIKQTNSGTATPNTITVAGGTHYMELRGVNTPTFQLQNSANVTLTLAEGSTNTFRGGQNQAGINVPASASLTVKGNGELKAIGGEFGAGIGGNKMETCGSVTIEDNVIVTASGGSSALYSGYPGIGGYYAGIVNVNGGIVVARGGSSRGGVHQIGIGGYDGDHGTKNFNQGIVFENDDGSVYGSVELPESFDLFQDTSMTIAQGAIMTIPAGKTLTVPAGKTLTNNGTIMNHGTIDVLGTLVGTAPTGDGIVNQKVTSTLTVTNAAGNSTTIAGKGDTITLKLTVKPGMGSGELPIDKAQFYTGTNAVDSHKINGKVGFSSNDDGTRTATVSYTVPTNAELGPQSFFVKYGDETLSTGDATCSINIVVMVAKVEIDTITTFYDSVKAAVDAAPTGATVTLLGNSIAAETIPVSGKTLTLDLNGKVLESGDPEGYIIMTKGESHFTIQDSGIKGKITRNKGNKTCIYIENNSTLSIEGGIVENTGSGQWDWTIGSNEDAYLRISGGIFNGYVETPRSDRTFLSGGTYTKLATRSGTLGEALVNGYAFQNKDDNSWVTNTSLASLDNVTVKPDPIKITTQPADVSENYGYTDTELRVTAEAVDGDTTTPITYQWYQASDNSPITNATAASYTIPKGNAVGEYKYYCKLTRGFYTVQTNTATVKVGQSATEFTGGIKVDSVDKTYTYGNIITVRVTPKATGTAPKGRSTFPAPGTGEMALFNGDVQLTKAEAVGNGDEVTFNIDTKEKALAIGNNTITAKYTGDTNMADHSATVTVNLKKKALTATLTGGDTAAKVYDGTKEFTGVSLTMGTGEVVSGDTVTAAATGTAASQNVGASHVFTTTDVTMGGTHGDYYSVAKDQVTGNVKITPATPSVTVTAEKKVSRQRSAVGSHNDTITLTATSAGANGEKPNGTVVFKNGSTVLATVSTTNGVASYDWVKPDANTSITITAEFTANDTNYINTAVTGDSAPFDISKGEQEELTITPVTGKKYGGDPFPLSSTGGTTAGAVSYTVPADNGVLSISGAEATIVGAGTVTVTATMAGNHNYNPVSTTRSVTIAKAAAPAITYPSAGGLTYGQKLSASTLTGGSTEYGSFAWTDDTTVVTIGNSGYSVTFIPSADTIKNYETIIKQTDTVPVSVTRATPTVTVTAAKKVRSFFSTIIGSHNDTITLTATSAGANGEKPNGTVVFRNGGTVLATVSTTNGVASYDWVKPDANTSITITAEFTANDTNYINTAVTGDSAPFDISKGEQAELTITPVTGKKYGGDPFPLSTTGGTTAGAVSYTVPADNGVLSISGAEATIVGAGTVIVTATMAGNHNYNPVSTTRSVTIAQAAAPAITYPSAGGLTYGQKLSASPLTGGDTTYGSFAWTDDATVPTVSNDGYSVTFTPSADTIKNYEAITPRSQTVAVTVAKVTPAISVKYTASGSQGTRKAVLTATLSKVGDGAVPTGTVKFVNITSGSDEDITGAAAVEITDGTATYTWTGLADQVYKVKAVYSGDDNYTSNMGEITVKGIEYPATVEGSNEWTPDSKEDITFKVDVEFSKFLEVRVNGELLDKANYTATSGSTIITLKPEYLKTLETGTYTVQIVFEDGQAQSEIKIKNAAAPPTSPDPGQQTVPNKTPGTADTTNKNESQTNKAVKTGDDNPLFAMMLSLALSGLVATCMVLRRRKQN